MASDIWQIIQWFDIEKGPSEALRAKCLELSREKKHFDCELVAEVLRNSPFDPNANIKIIVDHFNDLLETLY